MLTFLIGGVAEGKLKIASRGSSIQICWHFIQFHI